MTIRRTLPLLLASLFAMPMLAVGAMHQDVTPPNEDAQQKRIIIKLDADSPDDGIPVQIVGDGEVRISNIDINDDDNGQRQVIVMAEAIDGPAHNIESGGPWLGVQFGPVPKPLASHLQLDAGKGQMVLNVLEGSPADLAGFQKYDVITAIDGVESPADMGAFLDQIRTFEPNDVTSFSLIRGGSPTTARVSVGTRPDDVSALKYKYEDDTAHVAHSNVFQRGGIMRKDDDGNWVFDNLGDGMSFNWSGALDLDDAHFNDLLKDVPFGLQRDITVQSINGESVRIETDDDGRITVTKESKNGDDTTKTTATYADEAEFERADPDTFGMYHDHSHAGFSFRMSPHGAGVPHMLFLDKDDASLGMGTMLDDLGGVHERVEVLLDRIGASDDINADVKQRIDEAFNRAGALGKHMGVFSTRFVTEPPVGVDVRAQAQAIMIVNGKTTSLRIGDAGKITVTITDGDNETVEDYENLDQLKVARPDLAAKFDFLFKSLATPKAEEK